MSERDLDLTLEAVVIFLRRFVVVTNHQAVALALWVVHTHAFDAADTTPYIAITSAEKRSGKSRLLEVLGLLVREALQTVNVSDAALFRAITAKPRTLLFDEIDAIFGPKARDREDLRGLLNAGYRRGAVVLRMGGGNMTQLEEFGVYCPKAFAGIGELPDTIADRSVRVRLQRRTRDEQIERFRRRDVEDEAEPIRQSIESLASHHVDRLACARPILPDELDDRAQDAWEGLFAIADLAGGTWPERARAAALDLSTGDSREDESLGAKLLRDIRIVFEENSAATRWKTADLIAELAAIEESPWADWYGKQITPYTIAKLLKPYEIRTLSVWVDGAKARGYKVEQFADAFARVLGGRTGRDGRSESPSQAAPTTPTTPTAHRANQGERTPPLNREVAHRTTHQSGSTIPADAPEWERAWHQRRTGT